MACWWQTEKWGAQSQMSGCLYEDMHLRKDVSPVWGQVLINFQILICVL